MLDGVVLYNESNIYLLIPVGDIHGAWLFIPGTHVLAVTIPILDTSVEQNAAKAKHGEE